jgi:hypothetical protein
MGDCELLDVGCGKWNIGKQRTEDREQRTEDSLSDVALAKSEGQIFLNT